MTFGFADLILYVIDLCFQTPYRILASHSLKSFGSICSKIFPLSIFAPSGISWRFEFAASPAKDVFTC